MTENEKAAATAEAARTKPEFMVYAPEAKTVSLAGTFNDWSLDATPLNRDAEGTWRLTLDLPPGRYEYKFIINGKWCCEPGFDPAYDGRAGCVCNEHGTMNRVLDVT